MIAIVVGKWTFIQYKSITIFTMDQFSLMKSEIALIEEKAKSSHKFLKVLFDGLFQLFIKDALLGRSIVLKIWVKLRKICILIRELILAFSFKIRVTGDYSLGRF